jgi:signal transduction histidine kinase
MTNSKIAQEGPPSQKLWLPSLLLLAQFLTIAPVLLIVLANEQQREASEEYLKILDGLDRLSFAIADLETIPQPGVIQPGVIQPGVIQPGVIQPGVIQPGVIQPGVIQNGAAAAGAAWQQEYSNYRSELNSILSSSAPTPQIRETLAQVDSIVTRMAKAESGMVGLNRAGFRKDGRTARSELLDAQRLVRLQLSTTGNSITQMTTYLKALVAGACLLAFGVVFVIRKFRIDAALQRKLQNELGTINEEVIAALAAARSESEAKNQFLAHVGSLMRTPLNAIVGGTGELLQTDLSSRQRDCAQTSRELAESLKRLADHVIDYSSMESGRLELQSIEFDPAKVVTEVLQLFSLPAERKGLRLKNAIREGLPGKVRGDPERLRQVLVDLMSNAFSFTEKGDVLLRVEEVIGAEGRTSLRFEVKDTGVGITEQVRNRLFQPFSMFEFNQARGSSPGGNEATGLGLAVSKKLVELMGGNIEVASEPGRGSTFCLTAAFESVRAGTESQVETSEAASSAINTIAAAENGTRPPVSKPQTERPQTKGKDRRERRTAARHRTNYPTLLRSESAGVGIIRVLDASASGLRVSVPFRLEVQTEVEIRIEGASVVGIVGNCSCIRANEFHVGIQIPLAAAADEHTLRHLRLLRANIAP